MKKKIADSLLTPKQQPAPLKSEESEKEELMSQVLQTVALTEETVEKQKDQYLLEGK
ncbi:hypothetical protein [Brevibacillus choshinensis]|uniref:Uncharacterized protein n=1 Tax=Brevibacillus choshinensis TaxID=54911 RepID=A0ABX7FTF5_BRECH|nr:hypothetical protein [Brevibacillus choshinensis]QRG68631.1 hypothetical protein JNE38_05625 [Brevibacillus choshinensis]